MSVPAAFITTMPGAVVEAELVGAKHTMEVALVTLQDPWRCMITTQSLVV